jgi:hypothetical protein
MNPEPLPPSLRELEGLLARRPGPEPAADFAARLRGALADARPAPVPDRAGRRWRPVWQTAAAVALILNLGMSAANGVQFRRLASPLAAEGHLARRVVGAGVPGALDADDRFQTLAADALARLAPAPAVGALGRDLFSQEGERRWAMP